MVHPILFTTGELLEFQLKGLAVKEVVDLGIIEHRNTERIAL